jgi:hypothetical protein
MAVDWEKVDAKIPKVYKYGDTEIVEKLKNI